MLGGGGCKQLLARRFLPAQILEMKKIITPGVREECDTLCDATDELPHYTCADNGVIRNERDTSINSGKPLEIEFSP